MIKNPLAIYSLILLTIGLLGILSINVHCTNNEIVAFAQTNKSQDIAIIDDNSTKENTTTLSSPTYDTYSAIGVISSLNFNSNSISNITTSEKIILSGHWSLYVNEGDLSFFEADFVAAPSDGSISHTHQIVNLMSTDNKPIHLSSNGSSFITGTADIKLNGVNVWENVKITISISKGSTITIAINDIDTEHHFTTQPILGIVNRLAF